VNIFEDACAVPRAQGNLRNIIRKELGLYLMLLALLKGPGPGNPQTCQIQHRIHLEKILDEF
jgi:hypothetical protein